MNRPVPSELLDKYLNGNCSSQECEEVEAWYQSFENNPELNSVFPESQNGEYSNAVFEKIRSKIKLREIKEKNTRKVPIQKLSMISSLLNQASSNIIKNERFRLYGAAFEQSKIAIVT
ncbi:hypothetical protein [Dyadobacter sp. 3J3]|uniref:hypothetical protein n=1 Tax=Dyadobacter sp. 3J3 TaxID=2606600 RepID=UPI00135A7877|nr:hypothetical protein [Dyadobacter sp. 3J3]